MSFNYSLRAPLSSSAKAKINRYYDYLQRLTTRPTQIYRTKDPARLKKVQIFAQHDIKAFPQIKVAFVPNDGKEKMRITFNNKGRVIAKTKYVSKILIELDPIKAMAAEESGNLADYIDSRIDSAPPVLRYIVQAGEFEVPIARSREFITEYVVDLANRYGSNESDNHHYKNWLHGIVGYNFQNQSNYDDYRISKAKSTRQNSRAHINNNKREVREMTSPPGFWINKSKKLAKRARPPLPKGWAQVTERQYYKAIYEEKFHEQKTVSK